MPKIALVFLLTAFHLPSHSQPYEIPDDVERIVFLGNSITYGGKYIEFVEAYFLAHHPQKHYEFINVGLPSETVSGLSEENHAGGAFPRPDLHERLARVLGKTKPDFVFSCYGMNDGIYLPFDDDRFQRYKDGILWLDEEVKRSGADIIHITPPVFDERKGPAYANVLDIYSDWLISQRYTNDWQVIDIHWPMRKALEDRRRIDSTFAFAKDGVHPSESGHWFIARQVLLSLGNQASELPPEVDDFLSDHPNGKALLALVNEKQVLMKDAWLTDIGHTRPWMNEGLPMDEALAKLKELEGKIRELLEE